MATSLNNVLHLPNFIISDADMMNSVGIRWKKYVSRFNNYLVAMNITNEDRKRALLLHFGGFELQDIHDSLDNSGRTHKELTTAFTNYFEPRTNDSLEIFNFQKTMQKNEESVQAFYLRLKEMGSRCNFNDVNKSIKTQLILGTNSQKLRKYCFSNKDATLQDILTRGRLLQDVASRLKKWQPRVIQSKSNQMSRQCKPN